MPQNSRVLQVVEAEADEADFDLDAANEARIEPEHPCYACLGEATHEIRVRSAVHAGGWVWLDVCDECDGEARS